MQQEKKPRIAADHREPDEICDSLEAMGAEIEMKQLELGDYQVSDRLVVERKTRSDFEASIIDGRLFSQISDLSSSIQEAQQASPPVSSTASQSRIQRVVLIVEGDSPSDSRLSKAALMGAYSSIISDFGCAIFFTRSPAATAELVYALARHEQLAKKLNLSVYAKRKALTDGQKQRAIVEALPNVGPTLARALLEYFNTVENVMSAPESELKEVGKLGASRAKMIRKLLTTRYKEEK